MSKQENNKKIVKSREMVIYDNFWYKYPSIEESVYANIRKFGSETTQDNQLAEEIFNQIREAYNLLLGCFNVLPKLYKGDDKADELAIKEGLLAEKAKNMRQAYEDMKECMNKKASELKVFPIPRRIDRAPKCGNVTKEYLASLPNGAKPTIKDLMSFVDKQLNPEDKAPKPYTDGCLADQTETYTIDQFFGEERTPRGL